MTRSTQRPGMLPGIGTTSAQPSRLKGDGEVVMELNLNRTDLVRDRLGRCASAPDGKLVDHELLCLKSWSGIRGVKARNRVL